MTTPHTGLTRRGGRLSLPQVGTVTNSRSSQRPGGSSLLEASSPTWWLDYAQYRNEDVANLYVANKLSWRLFKKFKKRLSAMDNVRRQALLGNELTADERQIVSQPFNNYDWLKPKRSTSDDIQLASEMLRHDADQLIRLHSVLERFNPRP
ncbi:uncharacterized protein UMAG_04034 [Mycosarcoma maydis]|uniref:Uncharacterized protein n=1 Tax=Mycosarcoma maydis TaxID=5270 RepID=A0A0D1DZN8_MYCMD|nr:uncharacterized protein UMAG_04034 [Ustilago maydis 521]KIS67990.1 hypothetical protein UMAG_04034 [Ustilago maydis 521]|eukprot:XP_011390479.1 hypothetical protein UMAG_04034 [Ustilago maydis 521]